MAAASTEPKFREEMAAIEQCKTQTSPSNMFLLANFLHPSGFVVLSEAERTASLYALLQNSTQAQIKFFIAILQQMANAVPVTAGVTPATGSTSLAF